MGNYINPGNSGFTRITKSKYVDKTGLIDIVNQSIGTTDNLICISRPRRFGKSYAAQMLCAYYDKTCDSHPLFDKLKISKTTAYQENLNQFDVIYLDMTSIIGETVISDIVPFIKRNLISEIGRLYPQVKSAESFVSSLVNMVEYTGNKIVMIIDEWDAPVREAKNQPDIQKDYLSFLRMLFKNSGQTANIFAAVYMTGILPIKKDGTESAVSDFQEYTILDPGPFASYTGFTENEVKNLCEYYDMNFEKAKNWYDGYSFPDVNSIYNPYSVMTAMNRKKYRSYWKKTTAAETLSTYIDMNFEGLQEEILRLIAGEQLIVNTDDFENDFVSFSSKDDVLTLMIHLGYLAYDEETSMARIPNEEVREQFHQLIGKSKKTKLADLIQTSNTLFKDTLDGNSEAVTLAINRIRESEYAPNFYNNEQALRYVIKFAYITCVDSYQKIEELPSGKGIADVVFLPKRETSNPAIVVELKWNKTSQAAIAQIKKKHYPAVMEDYSGDVVLVGMNYNEKTKEHSCRIERIKK